jgi:hypothetical protein
MFIKFNLQNGSTRVVGLLHIVDIRQSEDGENAILRVNDGAGYDELHLADRYEDVAEKLLRFQYAAAAR